MKRKFIKYILFLFLMICPCLFMVAACDKGNVGTNIFVDLLKGSEETSSQAENSSEQANSEQDSSETTAEETTKEEEVTNEEEEIPEFVEGDTPAREHQWLVEDVLPTCTEDGYHKEYCETCGTVKSFKTFKKLGHSVVMVEGYAPTCQEVGKTSYSYCEVCKVYFSEQEDIPTVEHDYVRGLGSCFWCDKCVLRYEIRYSYDPVLGKTPYAVCIGAEEFTPFTIIHVLEIPDFISAEINGVEQDVPVTEIEEMTFYEWHDINKVILGKNLKTIGSKAFRKSLNIREIYDKSSMRVGELSLQETGYLTEYVKKEDIHYTEDYTSKISVDKASGCILYTDGDEVELIGIRDTTEHLVIPEGVTKINGGVFYKSMRVRKLTIAQSVNYIAPHAFLHVRDEFKDEYHLEKDKSYIFIDEIVMLNPQGWCFYEYPNPNDGDKKCINESEIEGYRSVTWYDFVYDYTTYYCAREEYFSNQGD